MSDVTHLCSGADSHGEPWAGRVLSDTGFATDDGSAPAALSAALATGLPDTVLTVLLETRVLVPVVAVLEESGTGADGYATDKSAHMSMVTLQGADGRRALPVFSGTEQLSAWDPAARPVPVEGRRAALAALEEGAAALLIDPAGPHRVVLEGVLLHALAEGRVVLHPVEDPEVAAAITSAALASGLAADAVRLSAAESVDLLVEVSLPPGLDDHQATRVGECFSRELSKHAVLRARLARGLDVALVRQQP